MAKSKLKDFTFTAENAASGHSTEELVMEAEVLSSETISTREYEAMKIVKENMLWSMGISLLPFPVLDMVGVTALQARSLQKLSELYGIPFSDHQVKHIIASLISGAGSMVLGGMISRSFLKSLPLVGTFISYAGMPIAAGALSFAVGKVFIQHFESGGTFLTFDPVKVHRYFKQYYQDGLETASSMNAAANA